MMKKQNLPLKKMVSTFLAISMVLTMAGCRKPKEKQKKEYRVVKESDPYYSASEVELIIPRKEGKELQQFLVNKPEIVDGKIRFKFDASYKVPKELNDKQYLCAQNLDNFTEEEKLAIWEEWISYFDEGIACFDLNGNFLGVEKEEEDPRASMHWAGEHSELFYCRSLSDGRSLGWNFEKIMLFDPEGKELASYVPELSVGEVLVVGEEIFVSGRHYDEKNTEASYDYIVRLDNQTLKENGDQIRLSGSVSMGDICAGDQGLFRMSSNGINKINTDSGKEEEFLLWSDTDLNSVGVIGDGAQIGSNKCQLIKYVNEETDENGHLVMHVHLVTLTKETKNPHAGKTVLTLGDARENDADLVETVVAYNLLPDKKVRIEVHDYSSYASAYGAYEKVISKIADQVYLDLLGGTGPDILVNFATSPSFQTEDVLLDLMPYLSGDNGLSDQKYYSTLLRAYEKDGKVFHLPTNVELYGFWGNSGLLPEGAAIAASDFDTIRESLPENTMLLPPMEHDDLLEMLLPLKMGRYIDPKKGRADFSDAFFAEILNVVKKYGSHIEEPNEETYEEAMAKAPETLLRESMVAMIPYVISTPSDYKDGLELQNGKGRVYAVGDEMNVESGAGRTDTASGKSTQTASSGMTIDSRISVAISKDTPYAQDAWDFIRSLFSEENQKHFAESLDGIPVNRSEVDTLCEKCGMTDLEKSAFDEELERKHEARITDDAIMDIVMEEAAGYFAGQKSIDAVVNTIQNRAQTVLKERG